MINQISKSIKVSHNHSDQNRENIRDITVLLNKIKTGKNLINSFYTPHQPAFNFLYPLPPFSPSLPIILLDILSANSLLFRSILTQLNTFKVNNIFFILTSAVYTCS